MIMKGLLAPIMVGGMATAQIRASDREPRAS